MDIGALENVTTFKCYVCMRPTCFIVRYDTSIGCKDPTNSVISSNRCGRAIARQAKGRGFEFHLIHSV